MADPELDPVDLLKDSEVCIRQILIFSHNFKKHKTLNTTWINSYSRLVRLLKTYNIFDNKIYTDGTQIQQNCHPLMTQFLQYLNAAEQTALAAALNMQRPLVSVHARPSILPKYLASITKMVNH
jgi:hypothetical protein